MRNAQVKCTFISCDKGKADKRCRIHYELPTESALDAGKQGYKCMVVSCPGLITSGTHCSIHQHYAAPESPDALIERKMLVAVNQITPLLRKRRRAQDSQKDVTLLINIVRAALREYEAERGKTR